MLLSNARIEKNNNIKFYEQDILLDNHIYHGNINVDINVEYINSGIGIALITDGGLTSLSNASGYLAKLSNSECILIKKTEAKIQVLQTIPIVNMKPYKKDLKLSLRLMDSKLSFYINDNLMIRYYLTEDLESYIVGYYSNADNIINSIGIASEVPTGWIVNLNNTNGGYIKFGANQFEISNCSSNAEVEQIKVKLKCDIGLEKTFYVGYEKDGLENDIKAYVFYSNDDRYVSNEEKNIMKNRKFTIKKDCEVNLKFVGTKGIIRNISISENNDDFFIGTSYSAEEINGSYIKIKTGNQAIDRIEISGIVHGVPKFGDRRHILYKDYASEYTITDLNILLDKRYDYIIKPALNQLIINDIVHNVSILNEITMFDNMDVIIDKLIIYKTDGSIIDVLLQDTKKQYVPAAINGPIILTSEIGTPLDISASYRIKKDQKGNFKYIFTNVEREVFKPVNKIILNNKVAPNLDTITVYGVLKNSNIHKDNLLLYSDIRNNINDYCDLYEVIHESNLYKVDKDTGVIIINERGDNYISGKYKEIVVDYLKADSYAINYRHDLDSYELDISTNKNIKIYYDGASNDNDKLINGNDYKLININMASNTYIVLKGR